MFGVQVSVLIVAVFTAFIGYQFRIREKKRDQAHAEITKSYNESYSPVKFLLKEIIEEHDKVNRSILIDRFFENHGLNGLKGASIGSSNMLKSFFELNSLYKAFKHDSNSYEDKFINKLKEFESEITQEFWDAHDIIYKEHIRYKQYHFNPVKSFFLDILSTVKFITEIATSIIFVAWIAILVDLLFKLNVFNSESIALIFGVTVIVLLIYICAFIYYKLFYNPTNNRYRTK